jgi:hypothetical protein
MSAGPDTRNQLRGCVHAGRTELQCLSFPLSAEDKRRLIPFETCGHVVRVVAAMRLADVLDLREERRVALLQRLQSVQVQLRAVHGFLRFARAGERPQNLHAGVGLRPFEFEHSVAERDPDSRFTHVRLAGSLRESANPRAGTLHCFFGDPGCGSTVWT